MPVGTRYCLFYGEMELGEVIEEDADFPNLFGRFVPTESGSGTDWERVQEYKRSSVAADLLGDESAETQSDFVTDYETRVQDLIETDDWYLLDQKGGRMPITIPTFLRDGGIVWSWRIDPARQQELEAVAIAYARRKMQR